MASIYSDCYEKTPTVSGQIYGHVARGISSFAALEAQCIPGGSMQIELQTSKLVIYEESVIIHFAECGSGEYYSSSKCIQCSNGTYSLEDNSDLHLTQCNTCPNHAQQCYGDVIVVSKGYWRISESAWTLLKCPMGMKSCKGGSAAGSLSCEEGYEGMLCGSCSEDYRYDSSSNSCVQCKATPVNVFTVLLMGIGVIAVGAALLFWCCWFLNRKDSPSLLSLVNHSSMSSFRIIFSGLSSQRLLGRIKIYLTLFQVLLALPSVLRLDYPSSFTSMTNIVSIVNLNHLGEDLGLTCVRQDYDYVDLLIIETLYPLVAIVLLLSIGKFHAFIVRMREDNTSKSNSLYSQYFFVMLWFTYLILPGVTSAIFQTFECLNVDPDEVEDGDDYYMASDYTISCSSSRYRYGRSWAIAMIIVYPIGIPCMYAYLLWSERQRIKNRIMSESDSQSSVKTEDGLPLTRLKILYSMYKPEYWYWEVIETFQRLFLTGFLVLIYQGSAAQVIVGLVIVMMFAKVYVLYSPFIESNLTTLKEIVQWQLSAVFVVSLLLRVDVMNKQALGGLLIVIAIFSCVLDGLWTIRSCLLPRSESCDEKNADINL